MEGGGGAAVQYKQTTLCLYNGPTNALVCIKTLIQHVDLPLRTIQHAKRMTVCCRITILEDSHFNQ
jgi:hypothetical protein